MTSKIQLNGKAVPVVAFYSVQGGVGKSTIARKFAELITRAASPDGKHPNVLLIDLDVETSGLTFRMMGGPAGGGGTVHEAIAARNPTVARAHNVTANVTIASGGTPHRGQLYLLPAAPPKETGLFEVIRSTEPRDLLDLLCKTIDGLVDALSISCVVIDCAPGGMPYSAAAATIADVPVFIGRNEATSYEQIHVQAMRIKELFPEFAPVSQRVVINAVSVKAHFEERAKKYAVEEWIPLTSDVIHEAEGLEKRESLMMLLFENYIIELIQRFLHGRDHLIPKANDVLPREYHTMLDRLERVEQAPKLRTLRVLGKFGIPAGLAATVVGIASILLENAQLLGPLQSVGRTIGIALVVVGMIMLLLGLYGGRERTRIERAAHELASGGADMVFGLLKKEQSHRKHLEELRRLSETIPRVMPQHAAAHG